MELAAKQSPRNNYIFLRASTGDLTAPHSLASTLPHHVNLDALVSLITTSVAEYSAELKYAGLPLPDLNSIAPPATGLPKDTRRKINRAVKIIEAACAQLSATVADPGSVVHTKATAYEESTCLQVVIQAKIADLLLDKPEGIHVSQLASSSGIDEDRLSRILRLLAINHVFREVQPDVFANNKLNVELTSASRVQAAIDVATGEHLKVAGHLSDYLQDHSPNPVMPFECIFGMTVMDFFTNPSKKERRIVWQNAIANWIDPLGQDAMHKVFPWDERLSDSIITTVYDIGAGNGHATPDPMKEFPSKLIQSVVQDLPPVIEMAKAHWEEHYPLGIKEKKVNFVPLDFFEESPVDGCDYYYIRFCLHDWNDELFVKIVGHIARAMRRTGPECRLLIHDIILVSPVVDPALPHSDGIAPAPLLPNFGASRPREYAADLNMMVMLNSRERSLKQMMALANQVGLVFDRIYPAGDASIIELKLS